MEIRELIGLAGVPVIVALVEGTKRVFPELAPRWYPLLALGYGLLLNVTASLRLGTDVVEAVVIGVVAALAASGLYSQGKAMARG